MQMRLFHNDTVLNVYTVDNNTLETITMNDVL